MTVNLQKAFEFLKKRDFVAVLAVLAGEEMASFTNPHFHIKGLSELALKKWDVALLTFTAATTQYPEDALFWLNKGIAEENLELVDAAVSSHEKCIKILPTQAEAYGNLANLYRKQKRFDLSEQMARKALELGALKTEALNSLGLTLVKLGRYDEASTAYQQALQADPGNAYAYLNRANLAIDCLRFDLAWACFAMARAISDEPLFRRDEGLARLLFGEFERGWELCEGRLEMPGALRVHPPCPRWRGENITGKTLLIIAEQGFGDAIQFCRYQECLADVELIWSVPQNLMRLLSNNVRGEVLCEKNPLPICDYYTPIMSLPWLTKRLQPLPMSSPLKATASPLLPPGTHARKIGLVWAGSRTHERDHERSVPLALFEDMILNTDADYYAPFVGPVLDEIDHLPIMRIDHLCSDFADTAALIAQMDCLITVDTVAAHLGGALGVKTFVLLPHCPDWRWGTSGETTLWYPSLTLLRQPKCGDWKSVIELLKRRL